MNKILILVLVIVAFISLFYVINQEQKSNTFPVKNLSSVQNDEESCRATDGEWIGTGLAQTFMCVHKYSDGGKFCNSSDECEGFCIAKEDGSGYCKNDDNPFGCYRTIENFRAGIPTICTD